MHDMSSTSAPRTRLCRLGMLLGTAILLHMLPASPVLGQSASDSRVMAAIPASSTMSVRVPVTFANSRSTQRLVAGGIMGGGAGLLVGGLVGAYIGGNRCTDPGNPDSCAGLEGLVIGAMTGEAIGIPLGVHLANQRRGRLGLSLAASAAIAAAGAGAVALGDSHGAAVGMAIAVPAAQLITSILVERRTD